MVGHTGGFAHVLCGQHWRAPPQDSGLSRMTSGPCFGSPPRPKLRGKPCRVPLLICGAMLPLIIRDPGSEGFAIPSLCSNLSFTFHCPQYIAAQILSCPKTNAGKNSYSKLYRKRAPCPLPPLLPLLLMRQH